MRGLFFLACCCSLAASRDDDIVEAKSSDARMTSDNRPLDASDGNIATSFAPGAMDVGFSPQLKNLRELAICSSGLQARQAGWQDNNAHLLALGNSLVPAVRALLDLGVPLHASFLAHVQLAAAAVDVDGVAVDVESNSLAGTS